MIPEMVYVGPYRYRVEFKERIISDQHEHLAGQIDYPKQLILIDSDSAPSHQFATYIHEVVHALENASGLSSEEDHVERFSMALAGFLIDNGYAPDPIEEVEAA